MKTAKLVKTVKANPELLTEIMILRVTSAMKNEAYKVYKRTPNTWEYKILREIGIEI